MRLDEYRLVLPVIVLAALALATEGLAREGPWRIGWLGPGTMPTANAPSGALADFEQRFSELGYVSGRDYVVEARFSDTSWKKFPEMARDLVARWVDVIATIGTHTVLIAKEATDYADKGALFSHYADWHVLRRRTADYNIDKILKGAAPGELPVEQPQKFDLVVSLNTAKTLGLTIPQSILLRAEKIIE